MIVLFPQRNRIDYPYVNRLAYFDYVMVHTFCAVCLYIYRLNSPFPPKLLVLAVLLVQHIFTKQFYNFIVEFNEF